MLFDLTDKARLRAKFRLGLVIVGLLCAHGLAVGQTFNQIEFVIATGGDDLRGDSSATATLLSPTGATLQTLTIKAQSDPGFGNDTTHTITRPLNPALSACDIGSVVITLTSHNSLFETDDNWNIQGITVTLVGAGGPVLVNKSSTGGDSVPLVRLTGSQPSERFFTTSGQCGLPAGTFNQIQFVINTGGDDLRGDSSATATLRSPTGLSLQVVTLKAQNDQGFANDSQHTINQPLSPPLSPCEIGDITITLTSHNGLFETDDNWNIQGVIASLVSNQGGPVLLNKSSSGGDSDPLVRLTGSVPTVTFPTQRAECNAGPEPAATASVTTYHNDEQRTGWNKSEKILTQSNVNSSSFGLIAVTGLDDQVDTQPLVVTDPTVVRELHAKQAVVYVATEGNTVYAIDSISGEILKQQKFGVPVTQDFVACTNNGPNIGINGTPVIDTASRTMFFDALTVTDGTPSHLIHAIDLITFQERTGSPLEVSATKAVTGGGSFGFNAAVTRQRSALLLQAGRLYVGFASFCDQNANATRGWVLAFNTQPLSPFPTPATQVTELPNDLANNSGGFFLTSVWMSGYGIAGDTDNESIYFTTGNSGEGTFNQTLNLSESAIKLSSNFQLQSFFTPANVNDLDQGDTDFASGGLMVLPNQSGAIPRMAVAAGKDGRMWILNRDSLGGHSTSHDAPNNVQIGGCWCGPSYFETPQGHFVVSSGATNLQLWSVPSFSNTASIALPESSNQDPGFFTSVSSNGTGADSAMIWAIGRQTGSDNHVSLFAFSVNPSGQSLTLHFQDEAGFWSQSNANADLVPTVANGRVYVGSDGLLEIYGLLSEEVGGAGSRAMKARALTLHQQLMARRPKYTGAEYWGTLQSIKGTAATIKLRTGKTLQVDLASAQSKGHVTGNTLNKPVYIRARMNAQGVLEAESLNRAKLERSWGTDHAAVTPSTNKAVPGSK